MPLEKSAGAVIFRKENSEIYYLLLHYEARHWDFSKGQIEKGEKPEEAARREIKEETGIKDIEFFPGFKKTIKYFYKRDKKNFFKIVIFFLAETKTKKIKISWEHQGFKWLPYKEALEQLTFKNAKEILKKANNFLTRRSDFLLFMDFQDRVYKIVKKIPKGKVLTYKEAARLAGFPKAWRAVGNILNKNKDSKIPCHRVIRSNGKAGWYNRGQKEKIKLLKKEGVF